MAISRTTLKTLWANSGGLCAYPSCTQELIITATGDILGHGAHIVSQAPGGPRSRPPSEGEDLDGPDNIILMCPTHHSEIDAGNNTWSEQDLRSLKRSHEERVKRGIRGVAAWRVGISQLHYVNIPRLAAYGAQLGIDLDTADLEGVSALRDVGFELNYLLLRVESVLRRISAAATDLTDTEPNLGGFVRFRERMRTKDIPGLDELKGYVPRRRRQGEPHLYFTVANRKWIVPIDDRWITTTTSHGALRAGTIRLSGIGTIVDVSADHGRISPIVIGVPETEWQNVIT